MTEHEAVDTKRSGGWMPEQDDLESWLEGHRERVETKGEQAVLHPVIDEFQELIDGDPVVRMYLNQMIEQVPSTRPYRKRHLESVEQMLRLINELLTMAPEFGEDSMVATPLNAILDWPMGTPAGFATFRDPRVNAMLKKILGAWSAWPSTSTTHRTSTGALPRGTISSPGASSKASARSPHRKTTR